MLWAVLALIALSVVGLLALVLLVRRLYLLLKEFGRVLRRAGDEFAQSTAALERASRELSERPGVD
jgi:hypothetical protein